MFLIYALGAFIMLGPAAVTRGIDSRDGFGGFDR